MNEQNKTYAVYYLLDLGDDAETISKKLSIKLKEVKSIIKNRSEQSNDNIQTTSSKVNSKNLMIMETAGKGTKSVAIMTKAASEINDDFRKNSTDTNSRIAKDSIYRPNK